MSVLVADDSPLYRRILARAIEADPNLTLAGVAEDGRAALAAVEATNPDVLLLDLRMPDLDGIDVLERLAGRKDLVKVLMSATLDEDVVARAKALGARACIPKHRSCADICATALALARR